MENEGGYVNDPDDRGGETYKGVARNFHPNWDGWAIIDRNKINVNFPNNLYELEELNSMVFSFYKLNYWDRVKGDDINDQKIASQIFDFAVNAGVRTSSKLAQLVVGATADGIIGKNSLKSLNEINPELFYPNFKLARISRYVYICEKRKTNRKYFFGWVRRTLKGH